MDQGKLLIAGRTLAESPVGIAVLRTEGYDEALRILNDDPAVAGGVFDADLHPFRVALMHQFMVAQREMEASAQRNKLLGY